MANPQQQYPYGARIPSGQPMLSNPTVQQSQLLNQYQLQMRAHAANAAAGMGHQPQGMSQQFTGNPSMAQPGMMQMHQPLQPQHSGDGMGHMAGMQMNPSGYPGRMPGQPGYPNPMMGATGGQPSMANPGMQMQYMQQPPSMYAQPGGAQMMGAPGQMAMKQYPNPGAGYPQQAYGQYGAMGMSYGQRPPTAPGMGAPLPPGATPQQPQQSLPTSMNPLYAQSTQSNPQMMSNYMQAAPGSNPSQPTRTTQPNAQPSTAHSTSGTPAPASQQPGQQPQNGTISGPGRPPSAMGGIHQPRPMMPGTVPMQGSMGGPPTPVSRSQPSAQAMRAPTPQQRTQTPQQQQQQQQGVSQPNGYPMQVSMTMPMNMGGAGGMQMPMTGLTPQQVMQIQYRQQQQQQQHRRSQDMDMTGPSVAIPYTTGTPSQHGPSSAGTQQFSPANANPNVPQTPATPASAPGAPRSASVGREPTPTLTPQSAHATTMAPPGMGGGQQQQQQQQQPGSSSTPTSATATQGFNRPPSAAGSASGSTAVNTSGMMPPPPPGSQIGMSSYPGMQPSATGGMGPPPTPLGGMMPGGMGMMRNDPSALTQLQMLGQQVGMGGVSTVAPGMFATPTPGGQPTQQTPTPQTPSHPGPPQAQLPGGMSIPGTMGINGVQPGQPPFGAGATNLRQVTGGLGPAPLASLQPNPRMPPGTAPPGAPGAGAPYGGAPLTASGPMSIGAPMMIPNVNNPIAMARHARPGGVPGQVVPPSSSGSGAGAVVSAPGTSASAAAAATATAVAPPVPPAPQNIAERTLSPRQRAALIPSLARITPVPADDPEHPLSETLPDLTKEEIENVHEWIEKDRAYEIEYRKMKEAMGRELKEAFSNAPNDHPLRASGVGVGVTGSKIRWFEKDYREDARKDHKPPHYALLWPHRKREEKKSKFSRLGRQPVFLPKKVDPEAVSKQEMLVPVRIDVDIGDGYNRLRDTFVWNANDPYVTPTVFAQTLCDDFAIGFGLGQASESARRKFIDQVVSSIHEQITDYKNHRVEIEANTTKPSTAAVPPSTSGTPLPIHSKPISTIGGLTVNGLGREASRSRSATPLPGEREKSEKPISAIKKRASFVDSGIGKKRHRPANDGPSGVGKFEEEDEVQWWERWRKRMRALDGSAVRKSSKAKVAGVGKAGRSSKPALRVGGRKSKASLANGSSSKSVKIEAEEVDLKVPIVSEPDEYQRELIFVDDEEKEPADNINEDLRILIKLDIAFGVRRLEDQFEWDISDKRNSPEQFAEVYCVDLGLSGEFKTAIAHSIREQVQVYEKSLYLVGHPMDGTTIQDEDLRLAFLPSLASCIRPMDQIAAYTPQLGFFNEVDLEKTFERGGPRKRRQPRGRRAGAIPLPDREPLKTFRSPMIGFPEVEKETQNYAAPRRQAAVQAERANAQIAVIESEPDLKPAPFMGTMAATPQQPGQRQMSAPANGSMAQQAKQEPPKKDRQELLRGPPVAARVLRSRPVPPSTAVNPDGPVPEYLRGLDGKVKAGEKKKTLYRERELPEGLHPNMIDGVWHCSSCGCPEEIAIGRRQGPLGPKTMCGDCGKWWHRHRKPMDIIYRTDKEYHLERRKKEDEYRRLKKKGGLKAAQAAAAAIVDSRNAAAAAAAQRQSSSANQGQSAPLFTTVPRPLNNSKTSKQVVHSPDSSLSPPPFTPQPTNSTFDKLPEPPRPVTPTPPAPLRRQTSQTNDEPKPQWLLDEIARLHAQYLDSSFYVLRKPTDPNVGDGTIEWRVKCNDCPQKLYKPGPEETLENFEVHLKNRQHLYKIAQRKGQVPSTPGGPPSSLAPTAVASTQLTPGLSSVSMNTPTGVLTTAPTDTVMTDSPTANLASVAPDPPASTVTTDP